MWDQLLPKMVGGTLIDSDGPDNPTKITSFKLTNTEVTIEGEDFSFGGARQYMGIFTGGDGDDDKIYITAAGGLLSATIIMPSRIVAVPPKEDNSENRS